MGFLISIALTGGSVWWFVVHQDDPLFDYTFFSFLMLGAGLIVLNSFLGMRGWLETKPNYSKPNFLYLFPLVSIGLLYTALFLFAFQVDFILAIILFVSLSHFEGRRFTNFGYQFFWISMLFTLHTGKNYSVEKVVIWCSLLMVLSAFLFGAVISEILGISPLHWFASTDYRPTLLRLMALGVCWSVIILLPIRVIIGRPLQGTGALFIAGAGGCIFLLLHILLMSWAISLENNISFVMALSFWGDAETLSQFYSVWGWQAAAQLMPLCGFGFLILDSEGGIFTREPKMIYLYTILVLVTLSALPQIIG